MLPIVESSQKTVINPFKIGAWITSFLDRWILSLQCGDTRVRVQMVVREQLALKMINMRNHLDVYSFISDFLDAIVV